MTQSKIRVFLVEDSPVALTLLKRLLASSPEIEVVGSAPNGVEALELIPQVRPNVICTDLHMPKMGGLEFTRRIMAEFPRPILVISASVQEEDTENVFQLLQAGALDIFPKPRTGLLAEYEHAKTDLINRIKVLAGVSVFTQRYREPTVQPIAPPQAAMPKRGDRSFSHPSTTLPGKVSAGVFDLRAPRVVAIGASTGGPQALHTILKSLPANLPVPILCVQHISEGFLQGLVEWLATSCALRMAIAQMGETPQPGTVYFAPESCHLQVDLQGRFLLLNAPPVSGHRPSVTMLFQSVAAYYRRSAIGVLLTGMGRDGAEGLLDIAQAGGITIAQDEQSCVVFGMPKEAIALNAVQHILPSQQIAPLLLTKILAGRG